MKAIVLTEYGPPEVLRLRNIRKPIPKAGEVLIRVHAATVHTGDAEIRRFDIMPFFWVPLRLLIGIREPRGVRILGQEVAGEVEAVGAGVTRFKAGDQIIASTGLGMGGYAEYVCLPERRTMAIKPPGISYEEAAAIPVGGLNALHFLREADVQPGQNVLIYGSTGSIGTCAVQLAKHFGAEVTAVCSTGKIDLVKSLGADHVIDYTQEDFSEQGRSYDVFFDTIGKSSYSKAISVVREGGAYIQANPSASDMARGPISSRRENKRVIVRFAGESSEDLAYLTQLVEAGTLQTIIDRSYPLEQTVAAHHYVEEGHKAGNVVLTMDHSNETNGRDTTMRAAAHREYGPPEVLKFGQLEIPTPKDNEVLIRVHATTVTAADYRLRGSNFPRMFWLPARIGFGLRGPRKRIPGSEFSGIVETIGADVTRFEVGDEVFGSARTGTYVDYICMSEDATVTAKPANLTFEEAAAVPFGGFTALYFLKDIGNIKSGHDVLIYGASGGVGTAAVQVAKYYGANVTGVCSTANLDLVRSVGADQVIDYTREDYTENGQTYDLIFETVGKSSVSRGKQSLKEGGIYLAAGIGPAEIGQMLLTKVSGNKKVVGSVATGNLEKLETLKEIIEEGKYRPPIDRTYPLEEAAEAHRYAEQGHKKGNVVITMT